MPNLQTWMQAQCDMLNIAMIGEIELVKERIWSAVYRVQTEHGMLFGKAPAHFARHEIALISHLASIYPNNIPNLIVTDPENGYMLIRDSGQSLRETLTQQRDWVHWETLLSQYAHIQQASSKEVEALLTMGIPDRTLPRLSDLFTHLIADESQYIFDGEDSLSESEYQRLQSLFPTIQQKADALAQYSIPATIQHGDLHDGNIFYTDAEYCFIDWGDASISHPFFSLRTSYVSVESRFELTEDDPELHRLRDSYLSAWREFATDAQLRNAFTLAQELWSIGSALIWKNVIDASTAGEFNYVLPSLMREIMTNNR